MSAAASLPPPTTPHAFQIGDAVGELQIVRVIDDHTALAHRDGRTSPVVVVRWPDATDADARVLLRPPLPPSHPHWLPLVTAVPHDDGGVVLTLPTVSGPRLRTFLGRMHPTALQIEGLARQIIAAVEAAHRNERVVGLLDPSSIWLASTGHDVTVQLALVGITDLIADPARFVRDAAHTAYVAPEVQAGDPLSPAADRYALGAVLFFLVTGQDPDPTRPAPPRLLEMPERIQDTIAACLAHDPHARPLDVLTAWRRGRAMPTGAWPSGHLARLEQLAPWIDTSRRGPAPRQPESASPAEAPVFSRGGLLVMTALLLVLALLLALLSVA